MKIPNFRFVVLTTNVGVLILNYADRAALAVAAPMIIKYTHVSLVDMGVIFGAFALTYAPASFFGGWLSDRFGPRKVMASAVAWWSLMTAATALCFNLPSFILQRLLFGMGEGPQGSVTARTMSNWFPEREYATAVGTALAANPLGAAVGTPIVVWILILSGQSWRSPFLVLGVVGLLVALAWYAVVRDYPAQHPLVTEREALHAGDGEAQAAAEAGRQGAVPSLGFYLRQSAVWGNALAFFGFSWIIFMLSSWYPVFLVQVHHIDLKTLAWTGAIPWVGGFVGSVLGGFVSDSVTRRTGKAFATRKWAAVGALSIGAVLMLASSTASTVGEAVVLLTASFVMLYFTIAQFYGLVRASVHSSRLGAVSGFVHFGANCAGVVAPVVTGFVVQDLKSWPVAFGMAAAIALAGALVLALSKRPVIG